VLVAWGFTEAGERVLLAVMLGMRESHEDWLELGRELIGRGLGAPMLVVADGAPGLIKAIEQCWPASDHRARSKPLQRPRHMPAILKPHTRSSSSPRAHCNSAPNPRWPTESICSPSTSPVAAATAAIVCERL
jgi:hypothetical protein